MVTHKSAMLILLIATTITSYANSMTISINNSIVEADTSLIFESWMVKNGKVYNSLEEKARRLTIFRDNLQFIKNRNAEKLGYRLGLNRFADLSLHEYRELCHGADPRPHRSHVFVTRSDRYKTRAGDLLPQSIDWRNEGAVTEVKDQGHCRSCWAFSTVGAVESLNKIVTGKLVTLSEQNLINCNKENNGCGGGKVETAYEYLVKNGVEKNYTYKAVNGVCEGSLKENINNVMIDGYENLLPNDELALLKAVAHQPVTAVIDSSGREFQLYESGIFKGTCGTNINHGVVVVGYGTENNSDYWIVRNSWGNNWGEDGYMKMARNIANPRGLCGIAMRASYPLMQELVLYQ